MVLGQKIATVTPGAIVWQRIELQLGLIAEPAKNNVLPIAKAKPKIWQSIAALASAAAVLLAVLLVNVQPTTSPEIQQLALYNNEQTELLWAIEIAKDSIGV